MLPYNHAEFVAVMNGAGDDILSVMQWIDRLSPFIHTKLV
jgi:hypothetical protein